MANFSSYYERELKKLIAMVSGGVSFPTSLAIGEYNVFDYGPIGTGDDTATIQKAVDACICCGQGHRPNPRWSRLPGDLHLDGFPRRVPSCGQGEQHPHYC
jgi:hypothetical protein